MSENHKKAFHDTDRRRGERGICIVYPSSVALEPGRQSPCTTVSSRILSCTWRQCRRNQSLPQSLPHLNVTPRVLSQEECLQNTVTERDHGCDSHAITT